MSNFFSYDKEKSYRDKLYNLGLRYDEVREKLARYECGELPPKHISELLVSMLYHIKASKALYAAQLKSPSITEQQKKKLEGNLRSARDCANTLEWLFKWQSEVKS